MRKLWTITATLLAVTAGLVIPAAPAHAGIDELIMSRGSVKCLSVANNSLLDGAKVTQWGCQSPLIDAQQWIFAPHPTILYASQVINVNSGKCLSVENASTLDGADIIQWGCIVSGSAAQAWTQSWTGTGGPTYYDYQLVNVGSGRCMSVENSSNANGAQIIQWNCLTPISQYQVWF